MELDGSGGGDLAHGPSVSASPWQPREGAFRPFKGFRSSGESSPKSRSLRVVVGMPMVARLTRDIIYTYQLCNPNFKYSDALNPRRFLTNPSAGVLNDGFDNVNSDLILHANLELVNSESKQRYIVKDMLGQGTFGQVAKCWVSETNSFVAVKIIKNQPAFYQQALVEVAILSKLNEFDPDDKHHIVRILDYFVFQRHLCITFEMLGKNLFELIKRNHFKGLSLSIVQMFSKQILDALVVMKEADIIHCDLKPENILISTAVKPTKIKVIDFGSACMEGRTVYSYIQSRYYRSPEVLLGCAYTTAIDMWSFGCIVAELFLGLPLFPGASEYDLLIRMIETLGAQPPDDLLRKAKSASKFFKQVGSVHHAKDDEVCKGSMSAYRVLDEEEYEARDSEKPLIGKRYFNFIKLEDIVVNYPYRKNLSEDELSKEKLTRLALIDFLRGLVHFDPKKRWSPWQASRHPFVTGEPFSCPYEPPPETPRIPVMCTITVDHNPVGGHWHAAGLSPQVLSLNRCVPQNSPHFQMAPFSYGSYGSMGSHSSYNDNVGLAGSYGSYGDVDSNYTCYPQIGHGLSIHAQVGGSLLGVSPDARRRHPFSHGNSFSVSPSTGNIAPMSLGASPSQFTPPTSQLQISTVSPGKFGPTSPARGSSHGSPLGKAVAIGQYNRRRSWGTPGTLHMQPHENASQQWHGHHIDGSTSSYPDAHSREHTSHTSYSASNFSNWRQQRSGGTVLSSSPTTTTYHNFTASHTFVHNQELLCEKPESSSSAPNPADWDPNYSDDLLLEEDDSEVSSLSFRFANNAHFNDAFDAGIGSSAANQLSHGHMQAHRSSNFSSSNQRTDGRFSEYSLCDGSPPSAHTGHGWLSHFQPNSPSRFRQQSAHRVNHMYSANLHGECAPQTSQHPHSNYGLADSHSPHTSLLGNGNSWGRRAGHPIATTLPSYHSRKDFGRIS
ncbi:putative dual-specificity kinase CMGC-DYRK-YAK family [Dioscorea sansibarensis]